MESNICSCLDLACAAGTMELPSCALADVATCPQGEDAVTVCK